MARIVKKTDVAPKEVKGELGPDGKPKSSYVCMCGLSKNQPFCDGSHLKCKGELPGKTYKYSEDGTRKEVKE